MKRIIVRFDPLISLESNSLSNFNIFSKPDKSILLQHEGNLYMDYLQEDNLPTPPSPYYVGEMDAEGRVVDVIGDASLFPHIFAGWDRKVPSGELPVIKLSADTAKVMLLRKGYLANVDAIIATLGPEIVLRWERAPYLDSNNPLVNQVLAILGLTPEQIYALFVEAAETVAY
jgi:hypothetical protein